MKRFFVLLLAFSVLGCGEGEQPFDATEIEDEESMDSKENLIDGVRENNRRPTAGRKKGTYDVETHSH